MLRPELLPGVVTTGAEGPWRVLFLCTGNSARSILAEAILARLGGDRFAAESAGSRPRGEVHALALRTLRDAGLATGELRSKSVDQLLHAGRRYDLVITVCDRAAEDCPVFPGAPQVVAWHLPDPAAAEGTEAERLGAFRRTFAALEARIRGLVGLPPEALRDAGARERIAGLHAAPPDADPGE